MESLEWHGLSVRNSRFCLQRYPVDWPLHSCSLCCVLDFQIFSDVKAWLEPPSPLGSALGVCSVAREMAQPSLGHVHWNLETFSFVDDACLWCIVIVWPLLGNQLSLPSDLIFFDTHISINVFLRYHIFLGYDLQEKEVKNSRFCLRRDLFDIMLWLLSSDTMGFDLNVLMFDGQMVSARNYKNSLSFEWFQFWAAVLRVISVKGFRMLMDWRLKTAFSSIVFFSGS